MIEKPHPAILSRSEAAGVAEKHFAAQLALLQGMANFGSNLVIRAFNSSARKMPEIIVRGVLLKQVVAMIDAVEVLLKAGCGHAAFFPARTAYEASIYLDLIVSGDSERRATRFLVANYRDERLWAKRATPGTDEEKAMTRVTAMLGFNVNASRPNLAADAATHLAEVDRILSQPGLQAVDQEFTAARGRKKWDPEWYQLDGLTSIKKVAEHVGRLPEYEFFYSKGSQVTHTGTYKDHVRFGKNEARLIPVRHLGDVSMLINFVGSIAINTFKKVIERYRPGESKAFATKYLDDWREPFQNVTPVKYDF